MKTVIEMAREAGIRDCTCNGTKGCLERFAALVAAAAVRETSAEYRMGWNDGQINEREACAGLCDRFANRMMSAEECADAIRARSNT